MWKLFSLSLRSLRRNPRRSMITLAAIAFGVAAVVFAHGFGEGLLDLLVKQSIESRTGAIQIHKKGYLDAREAAPLDLHLPYDATFIEKIRGVPGVVAVSGRISFGGILSNGRVSSMVIGQGLDPTTEFTVTPAQRDNVEEGNGTHIHEGSPHGGVLGSELAFSLESSLGDSLTLTASTKDGGMNALDVDVVGITRGAAFLESKRVVLLPLAYTQELLGMEGRVTEYAIRVDDLSQLPAVVHELEARLGPDVEVHTWQDIVPFLRDATNRMRIILRGISFILFAVVVLGVINTMLMSVYERVREIGTLLAIGARRRQVLQLFLLEASLLGALGGAAGVLLGLLLTAALSAIGIPIRTPDSDLVQEIHPIPDLPLALVAFAVAVIGALLAATWPAWQASRMNPVDALRNT